MFGASNSENKKLVMLKADDAYALLLNEYSPLSHKHPPLAPGWKKGSLMRGGRLRETL